MMTLKAGVEQAIKVLQVKKVVDIDKLMINDQNSRKSRNIFRW